MMHSFDVEIAAEYGINAAILLQNLDFWIAKNKMLYRIRGFPSELKARCFYYDNNKRDITSIIYSQDILRGKEMRRLHYVLWL